MYCGTGCSPATANATDVYTDLDVPVTGAAATFRDHASWPIPVDGLSTYWREQFA